MFVVYSNKIYYNCFSQKKVKNKDKIFVGDNVEFCLDEKTNEYIITNVMPRKNKLIRPFVTNVTQVFIMLASVPAPDFVLIDKLIINALMNNIKPVILVNKCDLTNEVYNLVKTEYENANIEIINISTKTELNLNILKEKLKNNITVLAGQSATGKTSLLNKLCLKDNKVDVVSKILRGKNTTTNAELIVIDENTFLLDTAGFSKLELQNLDPILIKYYYNEFKPFVCNFNNCIHITEGEKFCGVLKNINKININRYNRYKQIYEECKDFWSKRYD